MQHHSSISNSEAGMVTASQNQTMTKQPATGRAAAPTGGNRPWWQSLIQATVITCACIAGLELFLRGAGVGMEEILQPDPTLGTKHIPNKLVIWRMEGFSRGLFNAAGMRDTEHPIAKPPGTYRIALLGDSTTEGLQVPLDATYGAQLENLFHTRGLRTEVINFGCSGYSSGQEVLQFEQQVAQYRPDLTIVLYNRGDAVESVRKPTDFSCEPRPYFYLDQNNVLHQDDHILQAYQKALQPNMVLDFLRRNSRIYGVLSHSDMNLSIHEPLYRKLRGWVLKPFAPRLPKLKASDAPYPIQDGKAVTAALFERLNSDCANARSKLVVVAFPNVVNDAEFTQQIELFAKLAEKDHFGWFDLTPTFRWNPDPMSLFLQYHFSAKGHRFVAERIADYLNKLSQ
jgi:lysophospholipase L1-like esterase